MDVNKTQMVINYNWIDMSIFIYEHIYEIVWMMMMMMM